MCKLYSTVCWQIWYRYKFSYLSLLLSCRVVTYRNVSNVLQGHPYAEYTTKLYILQYSTVPASA